MKFYASEHLYLAFTFHFVNTMKKPISLLLLLFGASIFVFAGKPNLQVQKWNPIDLEFKIR